MNTRDKKIILVALDVALINLAYFIANFIRFEGVLKEEYLKIFLDNFIIVSVIKISVFAYFKLYKSLWKYASIEELIQIIIAVLLSNTAMVSYLFLKQVHLPRSIIILIIILDIMLIGGVRFSYRALRRIKNSSLINRKYEKRIMIIGAGDAGAMVIKELNNHTELNSRPVVIIDDDINKEGRRINGVPVLGQRYDIYSLSIKFKIDEIIIAMPSASKKDIGDIVEECKKTKCKTKILPGMYEIIDGKVNLSQLREVEISDLLGREEVKLNTEEISGYIENKKVLVTGGGGSIGSELCRQIAKFKPKELVILDIYENNAYEIQNELNRKYNKNVNSDEKNLNLKVIISSVRDKVKMEEVMEKVKPDVVFHAAAHKHVPLMEANPKEAIKNNVFGTFNVARAAHNNKVKKFVLISTDKAVNPTNIMGASKRLCEMIVQSFDKVSETEFVAVRFGNVLGSNGSVIPLFKKQIKEGGPVTVTHPDIIRYFMTIPEAAQLVIQAGAMAKGGEIFVLDMGKPVKIVDLAEDLIKLSGLEPYKDIDIVFTGLRPGEKLFEELLLDEEGILETKHKKIYIGKPIFSDFETLSRNLKELQHLLINGEDEEVFEYVEGVVPTYKRANVEKINEELTSKLKNEEIIRETAVTV